MVGICDNFTYIYVAIKTFVVGYHLNLLPDAILMSGHKLLWRSVENILAHRIRKSEVFAWDRNSYLTHVISPQKEIVHVNWVRSGCLGHHVTLSLG